MEKISINGVDFDGYALKFPKSTLLFIIGKKGVLGCGYFNIETADKVGEAIAVVSGVKNFDDMRKAQVIKLSCAAKEYGITLGMTGEEAIMLLQ